VLVCSLTALDARAVGRALLDAGGAARLRAELERRGGAPWETSVLGIVVEVDAGARDGLARECLLDLDAAAQRWARVPQVCARVAMSSGLLCAVVVLIGGLEADPSAPSRSLGSALDALALGAVGASFCAAVHLRASPLRRAASGSAERLVERARSLGERTSREPTGRVPSPGSRSGEH